MFTLKKTLALLVIYFTSQCYHALELDLVNGPGYADVRDVSLKFKNDSAFVTVELFAGKALP
ncbi:MAG: hypothetical protein DRN06_07375, partial [Thermoprotei archaeon]